MAYFFSFDDNFIAYMFYFSDPQGRGDVFFFFFFLKLKFNLLGLTLKSLDEL